MNIGDWGIKLGAVLLACFLWFHAVTEHSYTEEVSIRLIVEDPPLVDNVLQQALIANEVPDQVRVLISGRGKDLLQRQEEDFVLRLRTEGEIATRRTYRLQLAQIEQRTPDTGIQVEEIVAPTELEIEFDRRVERELPVRAAVDLRIAPAHVLVGSLFVAPRVVRVVGPKSVLDTMLFIATDTLHLTDVREDIDHVVDLHSVQGERLTMGQRTVRVRADIQILAENDIANVPVEIVNAEGRILRADPERVTVKVRGGVDVVSSIDPQSDISVYIDFNQFQNGNFALQKGDAKAHFEILEIIPAQVNVVSR